MFGGGIDMVQDIANQLKMMRVLLKIAFSVSQLRSPATDLRQDLHIVSQLQRMLLS